MTEKYIRKFKRQRIETSERTENGYTKKIEMASKALHFIDANQEGRLVNWMSKDETQFVHFDKLKDGESAAEYDDTDETEDEDDDCYEEDETNTDLKNKEIDEGIRSANELKGMLPGLENSVSAQSEPTVPKLTPKEDRKEDFKPPNTQAVVTKNEERKASEEILISRKEVFHTASESILVNKKPTKVPFCPKEVKRMLESEALLVKSAQSHTIRKIIVFTSLGIRHGCEDMYELDFNHFSILRKGEPYVSPENPGVSTFIP